MILVFESGSGAAVSVIAVISTAVTILIAFPNIGSQLQADYLYILYVVDALTIIAGTVVMVGFLIRETPEMVYDILFTVRYLKSSGWIHVMRRQERQHDSGMISEIFSANMVANFLICSIFLTTFLLFIDPESFMSVLSSLFSVLNEDEVIQAVKITEYLVLAGIFSTFAILILRIFPEIFNDCYCWYTKNGKSDQV